MTGVNKSFATRDELVDEVDQALAALRRVILRAIDGPAKEPPRQTGKPSPAPSARAVLPAREPPVPRTVPGELGLIGAAGIAIDLDARSVTFRDRVAQVSLRQAQLAAVLAKASPNFITRAMATERAWPDMAPSSRETTIATAMRALADALVPIKIRVEARPGYGLRLWAMEDGK